MTTTKENFLIIEFSDGLSAVPRIWVKNDKKCLWPPYRNQLRIDKAIASMEKPNSDWLSYDFLKIYTQADDYEEAKQKLKLEDYSDVDQLMGNDVNYKKTRHDRTQKCNLSDEENSTNTEDEKRQNKGKSSTLSLPNPPKFKYANNTNTLKRKTSISVEESHNTSKQSCSAYNICNAETAELSTKNADEYNFDKKETENTYTNKSEDVQIRKINTAYNKTIKHIEKKEDSDLTIGYLKEIAYMLNKQFVEICKLKKYIKEKEAVKNRKHENKDCVDWASLLPFDDVDKMDTFCKQLEKKENYVDSMIKMLKSVGGKDDRDRVNKMMEKVMTNILGEKFSRKGKKGKLVFENCMIEKVIVEAIMQCRNNYTEMDIRKQIGIWLSGRKSKIDSKKNPEKNAAQVTASPPNDEKS